MRHPSGNERFGTRSRSPLMVAWLKRGVHSGTVGICTRCVSSIEGNDLSMARTRWLSGTFKNLAIRGHEYATHPWIGRCVQTRRSGKFDCSVHICGAGHVGCHLWSYDLLRGSMTARYTQHPARNGHPQESAHGTAKTVIYPCSHPDFDRRLWVHTRSADEGVSSSKGSRALTAGWDLHPNPARGVCSIVLKA